MLDTVIAKIDSSSNLIHLLGASQVIAYVGTLNGKAVLNQPPRCPLSVTRVVIGRVPAITTHRKIRSYVTDTFAHCIDKVIVSTRCI
jgi:hypothetical protein